MPRIERALDGKWSRIAGDVLLGRRIVAVEYMSKGTADALGLRRRPLQIKLDDGTVLQPMADDEGNDAGALFTNIGAHPILPAL